MENTRSRAAEIDWLAIHESLQAIFASFAEVVQAECPAIGSRGGKTQTARFPLFSYRTFEVPTHPEFDPVVVGMNFNPTSSGADITVSADMCGEETGHIWFELPEKSVPAVSEALRVVAETLARELSQQKEYVLAALRQPRIVPSRCVGTQDSITGIVRKEYESHS